MISPYVAQCFYEMVSIVSREMQKQLMTNQPKPDKKPEPAKPGNDRKPGGVE